MAAEAEHKDQHIAGGDRRERAASVSERLRAAKSEVLASTPEPLPEAPVSMKPLFIGIGAILVAAVLWMLISGGDAPVEVREPEPMVERNSEPDSKSSVASEAAREARERVKAAEDAARQARERRAALEAQQEAQRLREAEEARRMAEEQAAALAAARQDAERKALEKQQAETRRAAEERAAQQERARRQALAEQQDRERQAALAAEQARQQALTEQREREAAERRAAEERAAREALARQQAQEKRETAEVTVLEAAEPVPAAAPETGESTVETRTDVFRQAKPGEAKAQEDTAEADAAFSSDPCKGPSARFLSTCR